MAARRKSSRFRWTFPLDPAPQIVEGFTSCLGVPRHFSNDPVFLHNAMQKMGGAHDRLLDLTEEIADEDPFAALRLLETCGISKFRHVFSAVPPALTSRGKEMRRYHQRFRPSNSPPHRRTPRMPYQ